MPRFLSLKAKSEDNYSAVLKNKVKILSFHTSSWKNKRGCQQKWYTDGLERLLTILQRFLKLPFNLRNTYTKENFKTIKNTAKGNTFLSGSFLTIQRKALDGLAHGTTISLWVELFKIKKGKEILDRLRLSGLRATWKSKTIETKSSDIWVLCERKQR